MAGKTPVAWGAGRASIANLIPLKTLARAVKAKAKAVLIVIALKSWLSCLTTLFLVLITFDKASGVGQVFLFSCVNLEIPKANNKLIAKGINFVLILSTNLPILNFLANISLSKTSIAKAATPACAKSIPSLNFWEISSAASLKLIKLVNDKFVFIVLSPFIMGAPDLTYLLFPYYACNDHTLIL